MDPFRTGIAVLPLVCYGLLLSGLNLRRRPVLLGGQQDLAALGLAVLGLVLVGPCELFMPETAVNNFGPWVWLLLLALYGLGLSLVVLFARRKFVIYNINQEQLRPLLGHVATALDNESQWAGDSLLMPREGVQLHLDSFSPLQNVSLVALGESQRPEGWWRLEEALRKTLWEVEMPRTKAGLGLLAFSLILGAACLGQMVSNPQELAAGMRSMLRL